MPTKNCERCGQENTDAARFCLACGAPLTTHAAQPEEERKVVTVLFADLVGFTTRSEQMDPEDVRAMLSPYYLRLRTELERFGGTVEKFIGDAVMAIFGAPLAHEDDPERAVRAAIAIRDAIAEMNAADDRLGLNLRIGVNTGEAFVVLTARPSEGEGMAAGDVVNTAARLQANAPVNGILVGETTYRATAHAVEYEETPSIQAKGKAQPVPVWIALRAQPGASRRQTSRTPLIGRTEQLATLGGMWERVIADRRPAMATALGMPGVGKSRLLAEFTEQRRDTRTYWGRCLPYGEGITYWPIAEIIKDAAGILVSDEPAAVSQKLGTLLEMLPTSDADELRTIASALANLVGQATSARGTYTTTQIGRAELHWGIRRVFELLAAERPVVLVVEDLHWAEPTLLQLLQFVLEGARAPLLLLATSRPELADARPAILVDSQDRRSIHLSPLDAAESQTLFAQLLGERELPMGAAERLLTAAGGNPLFLEELMRMLAETGHLGGEVPMLAIPSNLNALIGARLDALPAREKRTAQQAAVVGGVFWSGAVAYLEESDTEVSSTLTALGRRDLVQERETSTVAGEREWVFKHILIRDVAYARLPKGRRAALHTRCADWIGALPAGQDEYVEIVAYHLEQACLVAREVGRTPEPPPIGRAADALASAADRAERREGLREAERYYARALALLGDGEVERATSIRVRRGVALRGLGELRDAAALLAQAAEEASALDRASLRCAALVALANIDAKQGRPADAKRRLAEATTLADAVADPVLRIRAAFESSAVRAHFDGAIDAAIAELNSALRTAEVIEDRGLLAEGHLRVGTLLFNEGRLVRSADELTRCIRIASATGSHRDEARASSLLGLVKYYRGELDEAERLGADAMQWFERTGDTYFQLQNLRKLAIYALARGDAALAEKRLTEALSIASKTGGWIVTELYRLLTATMLKQGKLESAREMAGRARSSQPEDDVYATAAVALAEGFVAAAEGERETMLARFRTALALLEEQRLQVDLGEARIEFARSLRDLGQVDGARAEFSRAREVFASMDAVGIVSEIDRDLAGITGEEARTSGPFAAPLS
ncbi:MAG TPA: adenylate/guanylate cyclase domain-containing protein [Candidatus Limnocylindria bacterium]|nr:adenylate/guanylate cyclase domain-containing protein [Candidatus Limnocylindria bacterium]